MLSHWVTGHAPLYPHSRVLVIIDFDSCGSVVIFSPEVNYQRRACHVLQ